MYVVVGVIEVAVSALFYYYLEKILAKPYNTGLTKLLAWINLLLMNLGTTSTMGMLMYAGYIGGAAMLPENVGGQGFNADKHIKYWLHLLNPYLLQLLYYL